MTTGTRGAHDGPDERDEREDRDEPELPKDRLWQPVTAKWFAAVFGAALLYAVVRYHLLEGVPWRHFPLFILNKTISMAAVGFVACSYLIGKIFRWHDDDKRLRLVVVKFCGLMGFFLATAHAFMAACLLRPSYFGKYFDEGGRLNLEGELGMATGIIATSKSTIGSQADRFPATEPDRPLLRGQKKLRAPNREVQVLGVGFLVS